MLSSKFPRFILPIFILLLAACDDGRSDVSDAGASPVQGTDGDATAGNPPGAGPRRDAAAPGLAEDGGPRDSGAMVDPWLPPATPIRTTPVCEGTPSISCALLSAASCVRTSGCRTEGECGGRPRSCVNQTFDVACYPIDGCYWSGSYCAGTPRACDRYDTVTGCAGQPGCDWELECTGTPTDCELLPGDRCAEQPGCSSACNGESTLCDKQCVNLSDDEDHCGACGFDCGPGSNCVKGACTCMAPLDVCDGKCVDTESNARHCGGCGMDCGNGKVCSSGTCQDVDECTQVMPCQHGRTCENKDGGFACGPCGEGLYARNATECEDVDECRTGQHSCDPRSVCVNEWGRFRCGPCPAGYTGTGATGCTNIDECATGALVCDPLTTCVDFAGGASCSACPSGYYGTGEGGCNDIDECARNNGGCDLLTLCANTVGGRECGACPEGYTGDGLSGCVDIDECEQDPPPCDALTSCVDQPGGFLCTNCPSGYEGTGKTGCADIDECAQQNGGCDPLSSCNNLPGTRSCGACPEHYTGTGAEGCVPTLLSLVPSEHSFSRPFDPLTTQYEMSFGLLTEAIRFTATAPATASIQTNGVTVPPGEPSPARPAALRTDSTSSTVVAGGRNGSRTYTVRMRRAPAMHTPKTFAKGKGVLDDGTLATAVDDRVEIHSVERGATRRVQTLSSPSASGFGKALALDGNTLVIGADETAYVFERSGGTWSLSDTLVASSRLARNFGFALSLRGDLLSVGTRRGHELFVREGGRFVYDTTMNVDAIVVDGQFAFGVQSWTDTELRVYERTGTGVWTVRSSVVLPRGDQDLSQRPQALAARDGMVAVTLRDSSDFSQEVRMFAWSGSELSYRAMLFPSRGEPSNQIGTSLDIRGELIFVGDRGQVSSALGLDPPVTSAGVEQSGAVYIFRVNGLGIRQLAWLKPLAPARSFGWEVSASADHLLVREAGFGLSPADHELGLYYYGD